MRKADHSVEMFSENITNRNSQAIIIICRSIPHAISDCHPDRIYIYQTHRFIILPQCTEFPIIYIAKVEAALESRAEINATRITFR